MVFRRENLTKLANFLVISKSIICKKSGNQFDIPLF